MRIFSFLMLISIAVGFASGQNQTAKSPLSIVITVETPILKAGSNMWVNGRLTNTSNKPLDASGCYCGPSGLDSYLTWEVRDDKGRMASKRTYPHPELTTSSAILDRIVKTGESIAASQDISRLFDMSRPGKYVIQASRRTSDEKDSDVVKSNKVTVTVIR
jgi:hypothetical protein